MPMTMAQGTPNSPNAVRFASENASGISTSHTVDSARDGLEAEAACPDEVGDLIDGAEKPFGYLRPGEEPEVLGDAALSEVTVGRARSAAMSSRAGGRAVALRLGRALGVGGQVRST